jgi:hypothetical protein
VTLQIQASDELGQLRIAVSNAAGLRAASVNGMRHEIRPVDGSWAFVSCMSRDCRQASVTLEVGAGAFDVSVAEVRFGLPPDGQKLQSARPAEAVPSQDGDTTIVLTAVHVPAG